MRHPQILLLLAATLAAGVAPATGIPLEEPAIPELARVPTGPLPSDLVESESVRLMVLDVLVLDSQDRTVPDLTIDEFEIVVDSKPVTPDTLDVRCDEIVEDAVGVRHAKQREKPAAAEGGGRIVLAFDYLHLGQLQRAEVLDHAMEMVQYGMADAEQIMIAALNGGLRIEQTFSPDREEVHGSLRRMQHDITLWNPSFFHMSEIGWTEGVTTLLDVLGTVSGPKKVVFFSAMGDLPLDMQFAEIASQAAASRCSFYPVDARGLTPPNTGLSEAVSSVGGG